MSNFYEGQCAYMFFALRARSLQTCLMRVCSSSEAAAAQAAAGRAQGPRAGAGIARLFPKKGPCELQYNLPPIRWCIGIHSSRLPPVSLNGNTPNHEGRILRCSWVPEEFRKSYRDQLPLRVPYLVHGLSSAREGRRQAYRTVHRRTPPCRRPQRSIYHGRVHVHFVAAEEGLTTIALRRAQARRA